MKLFQKNFLYTLSIMVLITLLGHCLIYLLIPTIYTNQKEKQAIEISNEIVRKLQESESKTPQELVEQYAKKSKSCISLSYEGEQYVFGAFYIEDVLNGNGKNYSFQASPDGKLESSNTFPQITNQVIEGLTPFLSTQFVKKTSTFMDAYDKECSLQIVMTLQPVGEVKGVVLEILPFTLIICVLISVIVALWYSRRMTKPITEISNATSRMKKLERTIICPVTSKDEIGQLAQNVNSLYRELLTSIDDLHAEIEHVNEVEQSKIDFMRAASHELKTPVTAVCTMLDSMILGIGKFQDYDTYLPVCKDMMLQLATMIQEVLDASKLSGQQEEKVAEVSLSELLNEVCSPYILIAKAKGINFKMDVDDSSYAMLPQKAVTKAISNIISNAVKYTEKGKRVFISCMNGTLIVENECKPIPEKERKHLFEAFYRPDYSRSRTTGGNGLGLYLTGKILDTYRISYALEPTNSGMRFRIDLKK